MTAICSRKDLEHHLALWQNPENAVPGRLPVGFVLSLEGADSLVTLGHLERAYEYGLRALGPAHYGPGIYAQGTETTGGFPQRGRELLAEMNRLGMILDVTHLSDDCFWEAMDSYAAQFGPAITTAARSCRINGNWTTNKFAPWSNATPSLAWPSMPGCSSPAGCRSTRRRNPPPSALKL